MQLSALKPFAIPLALALSFALPAHAADSAASEPGSKTAIDRDTGRLRATTAAEDRELERDAERLSRAPKSERAAGGASLVRPATESEAQQTMKQYADGSVSMQVPESLDSQVRVSRGADGQLIVSHAGEKELSHEDK
jgi:hypothetical protein